MRAQLRDIHPSSSLDLGPIKLNNSEMKSIRWNAPVARVPLLLLAACGLGLTQNVAVWDAGLQEAPAAASRFPEMDPYGGLLSAHSPKGATGHFRLEKFGNRWSFVTPDGNAFFMLGVYNVSGDGHVDEMGGTYNQRFLAKYGDRKSTRLNSSHSQISYAVFCLKKKNERRARDRLKPLRTASA